ncbi:MAG TPA: hypothetical protein VGG39_27780 [Polyangiaceae bacterium]
MSTVSPARGSARIVRVAGTVALLGVLLGGACFGYDACDARVTRSAAASAWASYTACLTGGVVPPGGHPSEHIRAVDVGLLVERAPAGSASSSASPPAQPQAEPDWPVRCRRHVEDLLPLVVSIARSDERAQSAVSLTARLAHPLDPARVEPAIVDQLSDALAVLGLPSLPSLPSRPSTSAAAPTDPKPLAEVLADIERRALVPIGALGASAVSSPAAPDPIPGTGLRLAWGARPPWTCRFEPGLGHARCAEVRGVPPEAQLIPVAEDDAAPMTLVRLLFTQDVPAGVVRADDGERIADDWKLPAFVRADGTVVTVAPVHGASVLRHADEEIALAIPGDASTTAISGDTVVWIDGDRLRARPFDGNGAMGPIADLGPLPPGEHSIALCRAHRTLAVRVTTGDAATTVFRAEADGEGSWSAPVASARADRPASVACDDDEMTLTWFAGSDAGGTRGTIRQIACAPHGCRSGEANLGAAWDVPDPDRDVVALGSRVLAVRHASRPSSIDTHPLEGILARFAPLDGLAAARDRVLVADARHGGVDPARVQAFSRDGVAVVVVTDRDGTVWAMRVGREGEVTPVAVEGGPPAAP